MPADGLALPADSRFVAGMDVKRFTSSAFYQKYASQGKARPDVFEQLEEWTGLDPRRDIDHVLIAGRGAGSKPDGVALVSGRFDVYKLGRAIETRGKDVSTKNHLGSTLYLFQEGKAGAGALAFLDDDTLALGTQAAVEGVVESRTQQRAPLKTNAALIDLIGRVRTGSTFWMVGDQTLLSQLPSAIPAPGAAPGQAGSFQLPSLRSLSLVGDLEPMISLELTGEAADPAAARNLADVVRGFAAMAALQAGNKPELKDLASAISVATDANKVLVSARIPYELLDSLQPRKTASAPPAEGAR
jgi:hypothetical protein